MARRGHGDNRLDAFIPALQELAAFRVEHPGAAELLSSPATE